jgi:mono/diheme cytochrome c family protein
MPNRIAAILYAICLSSVANAVAPDKVQFNRDIRPILSDNCYQCHGPDKNQRKADLRLDTKDGLFSKIEDRHMLTPGHPEQSEIYLRITNSDADERMPQKKSNKTLTPAQIALIKKWIEQGADWEGHWAYIKPTRPASPQVTGEGLIRNGIDRFVLARLKEQGLRPSPQANRVTLIRRLSFDLLGLPPTPEEVNAFVNDDSLDAYEKLVDRLLASPHFGERMAVHWLDLVRYADSIGYHSDNPRDIAPYRDYVIQAFNENKHFDQFTIEQLAGDLLPNATLNQKVASGYNRLLQTTEEGGAQPKEYAAKYIADRVRNVSSVWLGATMACCECHDHKFDPILTREFYSLGAFFADVREAPVGHREAGIPVPDDKQAAQLQQFDDQLAGLKKKLDTTTPELAAAQSQWEDSLKGYRYVEWQPLTPYDLNAANGAFLKQEPESVIAVDKTKPDKDVYTLRVKTKLKGITAFRLDALAGKNGPGRGEGGRFVLTGFSLTAAPATTPDKATRITLQNASASYEAPDKPTDPARWTAAAAIASRAGWSVGDQVGQNNHAVFESQSLIGDGQETILTFTLEFNAGKAQSLGRFRLSATTDNHPVRAIVGRELPKEIALSLAIESAKRSDVQRAALASYFRSITPVLDPARAELAGTQKKKDDLLAVIPRSLITVAQPPTTIRILARGNWLSDAGDIVQPDVPHALGLLDIKDRRPTRLDLARWIVSRENPATARVVVNRLWRMYLGEGLSKRLDDLGSQGEWPVNPELLDWLAVEFMESGWDIKRTIRLIVTSAAYRQTSYADKQLRERDPANRLVARQSTFRLDAEFVRDNALAIAGMLSPGIGGASARPYQPGGYWDYLNFPTRTYESDHGENQYRRGLYAWWQRSFLHPSLLAFDAPMHEECVAERARSNIPQQALVLLNDPTYVEAARVFAARILKDGGSTPADRLDWAYRHALSRSPKPDEQQILMQLLEKHLKEYTADKPAAEKLIVSGEWPVAKNVNAADLAAWTSVARTILNLHETITRE